MKINVAPDLQIEAFSGSGISDYSSGNTNTISYEKDGEIVTTQRSSIDITEDVSGLGLNDRGRGIYYWEENSLLYIVNDGTLYKTNQSTSVSTSLSSGTEPITFLETIGAPYLIVIDAENDEAWYMNAAETVTQFTTNFPTTLVHGGAELNGHIFFMDEDGTIYNTDVNDVTIGATSFITAERENDNGVYLGNHHDNVVSFCTRSIEFFYYAANTSGSPLNRRQDIFHNIGGVSGIAFWENGDTIYFIGSMKSGQMAIYELKNFQVNPISPETLNSYITQNITNESLYFRLSGLQMMGHDVLVVTVYSLTGAAPGEIVPKLSFSYNSFTKKWEFIETGVNGHSYFPLMAFTKRTGGQNATVSARSGQGILHTGDIFNVNDRLVPVDTLLGSVILEDGIVEDDILAATSDVGTNIDFKVRTGLVDGGYNGYKTQKSMNIAMENTASSQTMTYKKSKETSNNFDTGKTIDTSRTRKEKRGGGRYIRCNHQLEYSGDEQIFIKGIEIDAEVGL